MKRTPKNQKYFVEPLNPETNRIVFDALKSLAYTDDCLGKKIQPGNREANVWEVNKELILRIILMEEPVPQFILYTEVEDRLKPLCAFPANLEDSTENRKVKNLDLVRENVLKHLRKKGPGVIAKNFIR